MRLPPSKICLLCVLAANASVLAVPSLSFAQEPATTTPAPTEDIGTTIIEGPDLKEPKPKPKKPSKAEQRRDAAREFLEENRQARQRLKQQTEQMQTSPMADLPAPGGATPGGQSLTPGAINGLSIPPFLLPIYQAAGSEYGIRWEILAAINEIETDYGRNLSVSSAGAMGWMQFMPGTWESYGVDANRDGKKDPYNPIDAIFAAARYLDASGASESIERALFSYNRADWYVQDVLKRARRIAALPTDVVGALSGLVMARMPTEGRTPGISIRRKGRGRVAMQMFAAENTRAIAVQDSVVEEIGRSRRLGNFVRLRDGFGNRYTYGLLSRVTPSHAVPVSKKVVRQRERKSQMLRAKGGKAKGKERIFAEPRRPGSSMAGGARQLQATSERIDGVRAIEKNMPRLFAKPYTMRAQELQIVPLRKGSKVLAGTVLGLGTPSRQRERKSKKMRNWQVIQLELHPGGGPRVDPKPIIDSWRLLAKSGAAQSRKRGLQPAKNIRPGQALLLGKDALVRRVLANDKLEIYECGRRDIAAGGIDRRVLATMEYLTARGYRLGVTSLTCGHGYYTASGNVSHHSSGNALDIATINGRPVMGNQGQGSITDKVVRELLRLQGGMKPSQIITLMTYAGADNTYAMGDHADHIHVGFTPGAGQAGGSVAGPIGGKLSQRGWDMLIGRLSEVENPSVKLSPSRFAVKKTLKNRR